MALINCRECGGQVSTEAAACPKCGAKPKGNQIKEKILGFIIIVGLLAWLLPSSKTPDNSGSSTMQDAQEEQQKIVEKKQQDIKCWNSEECLANLVDVTSSANVYCEKPIENFSKYEVKWTDKFLEPRFVMHKWIDFEKREIAFFGDKVLFQNGLGAFEKIQYRCDLKLNMNGDTGQIKAEVLNVYVPAEPVIPKEEPMPPSNPPTITTPRSTNLPAIASSLSDQETVEHVAGAEGSNRSSPSFDCKQAKSTVELLICGDDDLSSLDKELSTLFTQAKLVAPNKAGFLAETHKAWNWREKNCRNKACLMNWYAERMNIYTMTRQQTE